MNKIKRNTYYTILINFNATVNARTRIYTLSDQELKGYYQNNTVPEYYDQLVKLLRRYGSYINLIKNLNKSKTLIYCEPQVRIATICIDKEEVNRLLSGSLKP